MHECMDVGLEVFMYEWSILHGNKTAATKDHKHEKL